MQHTSSARSAPGRKTGTKDSGFCLLTSTSGVQRGKFSLAEAANAHHQSMGNRANINFIYESANGHALPCKGLRFHSVFFANDRVTVLTIVRKPISLSSFETRFKFYGYFEALYS